MLERWVSGLSCEPIDLSAAEIADACFLALVQHRFGVDVPESAAEKLKNSNADLPQRLPPGPAVDLPEVPIADPPPPDETQTGGLFPKSASQTSSSESRSIRVPTAPALRDTLPLAKALRPLMQQRAVGYGPMLDEAATVQRIAQERVWWPVTQPLTESWLELAIVVDESASMLLWRQTIRELHRFFKHYGVFRDVRLWGLTAKERTITVAEEGAAETEGDADPVQTRLDVCIRATPFTRVRAQDLRRPDSLIDPSGRRLILVVTDCVNELWQTQALLETLRLWGNHGPTAMVQMMPEWLWSRTYLRQAIPVELQSKAVGDASQLLEVLQAGFSYRPRAEKQADIKLPIVTLEAERWQSWTDMIAARGSRSSPGVLFNSRVLAATVAMRQRRQQQTTADSTTATFKVQAFRGVASPLARRLASLLAATPVITLPVVRLVQETSLPQSKQVHVAEVLLGGLLKPKEALTLGVDPDKVTYQFVEREVRSVLLAEAPVSDTTAVLSRYIEENYRKSLYEFVVELRRWMQSAEVDEDELRPLATITAEVLQYRGAEYADFVREVRARYDGVLPGADSSEPDTLSVEDFPSIEDFEFDELQILDREAPAPFPPLLTETFIIRTLERQEGQLAQSLEAFDITVAELVQIGRRWQVQRQQQQAQRFVEALPNELSLEMVAIPGGSFLMGSPEDEPERDNDESPQHEVAVEPFFMGRYPITQAQWRVVAAMPQVERELDLEPSRFKGDSLAERQRQRLPVEQVSWHDAVEFCARLSAHTGRQYSLPTESEWEYACRAGTTTPFHFGDMITTEVANYDGSAYAEGPEGEDRQATTPVDKFGIANAYGLSDMHGNVDEWCQDYWHDNYEDAPTDGSAWLTDDEAANRVLRGGSWIFSPRHCRSAYRHYTSPDNRSDYTGFRVSCVAPRALP